ncbi:hypothetical protein ACIA8O_39965 [Kitasatospora sp. NPDC051853]|uniref:hypothetical protein n=1 Tax=Kitasatospora sp. NPDC051853 TaxID=3364058 RepID=UPI00379C6079
MNPTTVLLVLAVVVLFALLAAAGAGVLARLDGATYPAAIARAATTFTAVLALATAITAALSQLSG